VLGAAWLLLPRGFPARWLGLALFLPLVVVVPERPVPGTLAITVLDVGQGQAVHVQTATHDLMFDTGPGFGTQSDAGSRILVPYLRASGVQRLDRVIVSHADKDHAGGVDSLIAVVPVGVDARHCVDGQGWEWDGVRFRVLHPREADYDGKRSSNALSCVLKIESLYGSMLIPGDIEGKAEAELLARHGTAVRSDILVAPHHGGKKTASPAFVAAVGAREVIFPVGYRNRFGHPHPDVLARFDGTQVHRTDAQGAVRFMLDAHGSVEHLRDSRRRYWHNTVLSVPD
jgi:competence protein ComEC